LLAMNDDAVCLLNRSVYIAGKPRSNGFDDFCGSRACSG